MAQGGHDRQVVDSITDYGILMLDPAGQVNSWSRGAQRLAGHAAEDVVGRHGSHLLAQPDEMARWLRAALATGRFAGEARLLRKDGSRFWAAVTITPLHDDDGGHLGFAGVVRDLTEARRRERVQRRLARNNGRAELARSVQGATISELFRIGMELQGVAGHLRDASLAERVDRLVHDIDEVIRDLRRRLSFD